MTAKLTSCQTLRLATYRTSQNPLVLRQGSCSPRSHKGISASLCLYKIGDREVVSCFNLAQARSRRVLETGHCLLQHASAPASFQNPPASGRLKRRFRVWFRAGQRAGRRNTDLGKRFHEVASRQLTICFCSKRLGTAHRFGSFIADSRQPFVVAANNSRHWAPAEAPVLFHFVCFRAQLASYKTSFPSSNWHNLVPLCERSRWCCFTQVTTCITTAEWKTIQTTDSAVQPARRGTTIAQRMVIMAMTRKQSQKSPHAG